MSKEFITAEPSSYTNHHTLPFRQFLVGMVTSGLMASLSSAERREDILRAAKRNNQEPETIIAEAILAQVDAVLKAMRNEREEN